MSDNTSKKWDKRGFMTAFYVNSGDKHKDWASFHKAMSEMSVAGGHEELKEIPLLMRCASINRYLKKAGMDEWIHPAKPKKQPAKKKSTADIAREIMFGDEDGISVIKSEVIENPLIQNRKKS
jgi:hypothetical protein